MARRRKIPVRHHHGVRDPLKQQEERELKLKNVVNNPPEKVNDQKVSFKFKQFQKLVTDTKAGRKPKKSPIGREDLPKQTAQNKIQPIRQMADETDENYLKRVNRVTTASLREARYEAKYGVKVVRNPKTGEIQVLKQDKNELDELLKEKRKQNKSGRTKKNEKKEGKPIDPQLARELVKQAIKEDEEEKTQAKSAQKKEYEHDVIKFGEIVHGPPTLTALPRKAVKSETVPRPGMKTNLLLKQLFNKDTSMDNTESEGKAEVKKRKAANAKNAAITKAKLKGKRKDLPAATRNMLETEQTKMIDLYRQLKKSKLENKTV